TGGGAPTINTRLSVGAPAPGANNGWFGVLASPFAPGAVLLQSTRASPVGAPAPGANNGWFGVLASPFAPGAVLLQSTGASPQEHPPRVRTTAGSVLWLHPSHRGGAPTINTCLSCRSTRPGCERDDAQSRRSCPHNLWI